MKSKPLFMFGLLIATVFVFLIIKSFGWSWTSTLIWYGKENVSDESWLKFFFYPITFGGCIVGLVVCYHALDFSNENENKSTRIPTNDYASPFMGNPYLVIPKMIINMESLDDIEIIFDHDINEKKFAPVKNMEWKVLVYSTLVGYHQNSKDSAGLYPSTKKDVIKTCLLKALEKSNETGTYPEGYADYIDEYIKRFDIVDMMKNNSYEAYRLFLNNIQSSIQYSTLTSNSSEGINEELNSLPTVEPEASVVNEDCPPKPPVQKSKSIGFSVSFRDGTIYHEKKAVNTWIFALKKIGLENIWNNRDQHRAWHKVNGRDVCIVERTETRRNSDGKSPQTFVDGYYVMTQLSNDQKVNDLKSLSEYLPQMGIEIVWEKD